MIESMFQMPNIIFLIPIVAIVGGVIGGTVKGVASTMQKHADTKERESTRREIAAYIAEGSMTPEEGERLLRAGQLTK